MISNWNKHLLNSNDSNNSKISESDEISSNNQEDEKDIALCEDEENKEDDS